MRLKFNINPAVIHEFPHYLLKLLNLLSQPIHSLSVSIFLNFEGLIFLLQCLNHLLILSRHSFLLHIIDFLGGDLRLESINFLIFGF
jgi:hypothetical protein